MFAMDYTQEGMLIAMIAHPSSSGLKVKSVNDSTARKMPGIHDIFTLKTLADDYERNAFDTTTFTEMVAVVGKSTWEVMNAKKALEIEWEEISNKNVVVQGWAGKETVKIPARLESTHQHRAKMAEASRKPGNLLRRDGDPEATFKHAARILERTYTAP